MKGSCCCSGRCLGRSLWCCTSPAAFAGPCQEGSVLPAGSGPKQQRGGFPDNGRAVLYIIWDLQNKLEGLENPPAIVGAQSLQNFLVSSMGLFFIWGLQGEKDALGTTKRKGRLWHLICAAL